RPLSVVDGNGDGGVGDGSRAQHGQVGVDGLIARTRKALAQARKEKGFLTDVRDKIDSGVYAHEENPPRKTSHVWDTFHVVKDVRTNLRVAAYYCTLCNGLLCASGDGCTTTMVRHLRSGCQERNKDSAPRPAPNADVKRRAKKAAVVACAEGMLSFDAVCSDSMTDFAQAMVDIGSKYGSVDARQLVPSSIALSTAVTEEADHLRAELVPTIKAAMASGACAATVDGWTETRTQRHYFSFTVHFIDDNWNLTTEYLLTIGFDDDEESGENILRVLRESFEAELGITGADLEEVTFVTDNGANLVKALEGFRRHYCICHGLNIAARTGMSIKYRSLIRKCLDSSPRAAQIVEVCAKVVKFIKDTKGRQANARMTRVKRALRQSKHHLVSHIKMLQSLVDHFPDVKQTQLPGNVENHEIGGENGENSSSSVPNDQPMNQPSCSATEGNPSDNQLPPDYEWGQWSEEEEEVASYMEQEDEEEETRRDPSLKPAKTTKKAAVKCNDCSSSFQTLQGYIKHRVGHGMIAAYLKLPSAEDTIQVSTELALLLLKNIGTSVLSGGFAPEVSLTANTILNSIQTELVQLFLKHFSNKMLAYVCRSIRCENIETETQSLHERYATAKQSTDSLDFKQNMHFIGGSNVKSILRTALRKKNSGEWARVIQTIRNNFLVSELSNAPAADLMECTLRLDRGKLLKISDIALQFFVKLGTLVKPLERLDGSLLNSEVFDCVGKSSDLLRIWSELKGSLSESESFKFLHALISQFWITWRNGIVTRRQDEMALRKHSEKLGTGSVAFRAKLAGR
ncbi:Transposable element Hobo transposase, partial [Frankliniella fusca]